MASIFLDAYTPQIDSSRPIAKTGREPMPCLWVTGRPTPDCGILTRLQGERRSAIEDEGLTGILTLFMEPGCVTLATDWLDGIDCWNPRP
jgi:hypothetical protein